VASAAPGRPIRQQRDVFVGSDLGGDRLKIGLTSGQAAVLPPGTCSGQERALFAAGDAGADVEQPFRFDVLRNGVRFAKKSVLPPSIITSPGRKQRDEFFDELIDGRPGLLTHQHHLSRRCQAADQFFQGVAARRSSCRWPGPPAVRQLADGAVVDRDLESAALDVQGEVFRPSRPGRLVRCHNLESWLGRVQRSGFRVQEAGLQLSQWEHVMSYQDIRVHFTVESDRWLIT